MSSNTEELQLFKKDPATDGATNFDLKTMINDNLDKIDARAIVERLHREDIANPHSTTAAQVGAYSKTEADANYAPKAHVGTGGASHANVIAGGAAGFMTGPDKAKLDGVATGANNYSHPTGDGNQHVPATGTTNNAKVLKAGATAGSAAWANVDFSEVTGKPTTLSGYGITDAAPSSHVGTGGASHAAAVANGANGFMTGADKTKLDGIASGAEVNQNTFANVKVGATTIAADGKTDTLELIAGTNIVLTPDAANDTVTIALNGGMETTAGAQAKADAVQTNLTAHIGTGGTAHAAVIAGGAAGFITGADKTKLDGIATGANNYSHPTGDGNQHVPATGTTNSAKVLKAGATAGSAAWANVDFSEVTGKPTTLGGYGITDAAPSSHVGTGGTAHAAVVAGGANGFITGADKTKLDGIATGANNYTHPTGDGNQHVPATGTTNNGKVLKAGATAGSAAWAAVDFAEVTGKPTTLGGYGITDAAPSSHATNTANPHATTAAQVGAYSKTEADANYAPKAHVGAAGTTAHPDATTTASGFMTAADKAKLNGIATGAEVNQNAFANIVVGATTIAADAESDSLTLVATAPLTITPDATNDKITFDVANVTTGADGLMIAADKAKLDGIAAGANNYTHPANHPPSIITQDASNRFVSDTEKTTWNGKASTAAVTTGANGLMIAADKAKLDGIASGADVNQNAFASVIVGGNTLAADSESDSFQVIAGDGIALTSDAANDNFTISLASPSWINLVLQNGAAVSLGRTPRYTKIGKEVIIEGELANIAAGTTIATLPAGLRPPSPRGFKVAHNSSVSNDGVTIYVDITGAVVINAVANATNGISLNGVRFFVD
jgi:hypothetical protein